MRHLSHRWPLNSAATQPGHSVDFDFCVCYFSYESRFPVIIFNSGGSRRSAMNMGEDNRISSPGGSGITSSQTTTALRGWLNLTYFCIIPLKFFLF